MLSEKGEEGEEMSGNGNVELLEGPITGALVKLSLPIMGTSLIQMAYNLTDMIWVGRLSSDAVAAVGVAGMYLWLSRGLAAFPRMGGQIRVGQCLGAGKKEEARRYARSAMQIGIFLGLLFEMCIRDSSDPAEEPGSDHLWIRTGILRQCDHRCICKREGRSESSACPAVHFRTVSGIRFCADRRLGRNGSLRRILRYVGLDVYKRQVPLTLTTLVMVAVMLSATKALASRSGKYFVKQQVDMGKVNGYIEEMMEGQKVVKVFCHEDVYKRQILQL